MQVLRSHRQDLWMYSRWKTCWNSAGGDSRLAGDCRVERALGEGMALDSAMPSIFQKSRRIHVKTVPESM